MSLLVSAAYPDISSTDLTHTWTQSEIDHREQPLDLPDDALALSWARYRREQARLLGNPDLSAQEPTPEDREQAQLCRRYFQDRILMRMLRGRELTTFQTDLYQMLTDVPRRRHEGMLYRLPYFYVEDQQRRSLLGQFTEPDPEVQNDWTQGENLLALTPVQSITCYRRQNNSQEYWWRSQQGWAVKWIVQCNNPLASLVQGLWEQQDQPVRILTQRVQWRRYYQMWYLMPTQPVLA